MLGYITSGTNGMDASSRFYDSLFTEINIQHNMHGPEKLGYVVRIKQ